MKKTALKLTLSAFLLISSVTGSAAENTLECMQKLPDVISFVNVKDPMKKIKDGFHNYEAETPGLGYSQTYGNNVCFVTADLYNYNLKKVTAKDIEMQQEIAEEELSGTFNPESDTIEQIYVTFVGDYFFRLRTTCIKMYSGAEERYNEMVARVASAAVEENVAASLYKCLK